MRIKTTGEINARTQDGRDVAASEGSTVDIDDDDAAMVGLAKSLILSGQAVHYGDAGDVGEEAAEPAPESAPPPASPPAPPPDADEDPEDLDEDDED